MRYTNQRLHLHRQVTGKFTGERVYQCQWPFRKLCTVQNAAVQTYHPFSTHVRQDDTKTRHNYTIKRNRL